MAFMHGIYVYRLPMQGLHANEPCKLYTADLAVTPWTCAYS